MIGNRPHLTYRRNLLSIEGVSADALAKRFGTPLYVYSTSRVQENATRLLRTLQRADKRIGVAYSFKANANPALLPIIRKAGLEADCASVVELAAAARAGFHELVYTGVFASGEEILRAARNADIMVLDDESRLLHVPKSFKGVLSFRVNPGTGNGHHPGVVTGGDTKFGIPRRNIVSAYRAAVATGRKRFGLHMMIGSGVLEWREFIDRTKLALDIAREVQLVTGITMEVVDIGGGLGIPYRPEETPLDVNRMAKGIAGVLKRHGAAPPRLLLEPGRAVVADAGLILSRVTAVKPHPRRFVGVDAGMHTLIRPALYNAYHEVIPVLQNRARGFLRQTIVGPICETTDVLAEKRLLPELREGDLVAILDAGAYGAVMASRYGNRGLPKEVLVDKGRVQRVS